MAIPHLNIELNLSDASYAYLEACARIRKISCTRLIERMMRIICDDQMILSVLDDDSRQLKQMGGETTVSRFHHRHVK